MSARRPGLTLLGAICVLAALGLPWSYDTSQYVSGWIVPSYCIPTADGTMFCSAAFQSPGFFTGSRAAAGTATPARVFLVVALVLVVVGVRRSATRLIAAAGAAALVGVVVTGPVLLAGPVAAAFGGFLLLRSVRSVRPTPPEAGQPGPA